MATKYPEVDSTSGLGSLPPEENVHRDFEETLTTEPTEAEADRGGDHAVPQESYDREIWRLQGKGVSKLTLKGMNSHKVTVSESKFQASSSTPAPATERTWPLYSDGQDVPPQRVEHMRNSGKEKSTEVRQIYSKLADQLQEFEGGEDCYLLPIENGILFSQKEIATSSDDTPDSVWVEHEPRRGKVHLAATVSQDSCITYRPGQREDGGNFLIFDEIGSGFEATVYMAKDVLTGDNLAVKKMKISKAILDMLHGKNPFAVFLKLAGCEQTCRAYGVILDEDDNSVYFLMELLEGRTLADLLGDENFKMDIRFAVDYTIDILKGLEYIHSKGLIHSDIIGVNVMIVGPRAIIIDTTGARNPSCPSSLGYLRDVENAINLLNDMLCKNTNCSGTWKASDKARRMFHKKTLEKLEKLLEEQYESLHAKSKSPTMDKIETLLQDLGIISEELKGLRLPSDSPDSSVDEPYQSDKGASLAELTIEELKAEREKFEELKAENEKCKKDWMEKLEKQEDQMAELRESVRQLSCHEAEAKREREMRKKAEQEAKLYKDLYEKLARKMQKTADKNEDPRAEE